MRKETIRLTQQGKLSERKYVIQKLDGVSTIGAMWSTLHSSKYRQEIEDIFNSEQFNDYKKYNELS